MRKTVFVCLAVFLTACASSPAPSEPARPASRPIVSVVMPISTAPLPKREEEPLPVRLEFGFANPKDRAVRITAMKDYATFAFIGRSDLRMRLRLQVVDKASGRTIIDWVTFIVARAGEAVEIPFPVSADLDMAARERRDFEVRTRVVTSYPASGNEQMAFVPKLFTFTDAQAATGNYYRDDGRLRDDPEPPGGRVEEF